MNDDTLDFSTPLPGTSVPAEKAKPLISQFLKRFRVFVPPDIPSNIPTACILKGRKDNDYFKASQFIDHEYIYFYMDFDLLYIATPREILNYLNNKEPWEDYDICLFDDSLEWCVGITHNDEIFVTD